MENFIFCAVPINIIPNYYGKPILQDIYKWI